MEYHCTYVDCFHAPLSARTSISIVAVTARSFWPLWPRQIAEVLRRDGRVIFLCMDWLALVAGDDSGIVPDLQVAVDQPPGGY